MPANENILKQISTFEQLFFTSRLAVCEFFDTLAFKQIDIRRVTASLNAATEAAKTELTKRAFSYPNGKMILRILSL